MAMLRSITREPLTHSSCGGCQSIQVCLLHPGHKRVKSFVAQIDLLEQYLFAASSESTICSRSHSVMTLTWSVSLGWCLRPSYLCL
jgi:hypothetical protein